jgi:hypothetical protein
MNARKKLAVLSLFVVVLLSFTPAEYAAACGGDESGPVSPPWGGET